VLPREFYDRDARVVAKELLGKVLVRRVNGHTLAGRIVENEAYLGESDPAAHSAAGKTARNAVLFGPPGYAYVYFIYGNHYCLNVSCLPPGNAGCVLIRALEPLGGIEQMVRLRGLKFEGVPQRASELRLLTSGPGRLCQAMAITRERNNGADVTKKSELYVAEDGFVPEKIVGTPRIGITKAADEILRYVIAGNPFVSGKRA
jgi:DNA-3-methyladenine glycosylase